MFKYLISLSTFLLALSCTNKTPQNLEKGPWLFSLSLDSENREIVLPFNAELIDSNLLIIKNAEEKIEVTNITYRNDSIFIVMPVFGSEFKGKYSSTTIEGDWYNYLKGENYAIPFKAVHGTKQRFYTNSEPGYDVNGQWQSYFISASNDTSSAIGVFKQIGQRITGTFLTETGDYRYLEGTVDGNQLKLSAFDGSHAFLFKATIEGSDQLKGSFRSGNHWQSTWIANRTEDTELADMKTLTWLKPGYDKLAFSFPDENGNLVSLEDEQFKGKVVIVQIFGTWCPNCMDETRYLVELYEKYHEQGLEIIGLDFELKSGMDYFKEQTHRFRKDLNVTYPTLLAGVAKKDKAAEALPMLNHILSYPTSIIIDKQGNIREIHTGFSGPGTGQAYLDYTRETDEFIQELLSK